MIGRDVLNTITDNYTTSHSSLATARELFYCPQVRKHVISLSGEQDLSGGVLNMEQMNYEDIEIEVLEFCDDVIVTSYCGGQSCEGVQVCSHNV